MTPLKVEMAPESARQEITARNQSMLQARAERIKVETQAGAAADLKQARKAKFSREMMPAAAEAAKVNAAAVPRSRSFRRSKPDGSRSRRRRSSARAVARTSRESPRSARATRGRRA